MKVVLVPSNVDGSGCYRCLFPGRELKERAGWVGGMAPNRWRSGGAHPVSGNHLVVEYGDFGGERPVFLDEWLLGRDFDVLWWQQRHEGWSWRLETRLRAQGKAVVVDSDDAWWGLPAWNPGSGKPRAHVEATKRQLRAADGVSVATPALAELYAPLNRNIRVIRNYLDWRMWEDVVPAYEVVRRRVRVGWMGEMLWRQGDLEVLRPWLGDWLHRHPGVEFVAAGDPRVHDFLGVPAGQRVSTNRSEFYEMDLADITATFDIGLVPLDLSTPEARRLNECKSHLKGLEYAACGIPCVASPTESYRWWGARSDGTFLPETQQGWVDALDYLVGDWRRYGRLARTAAEQNTVQEHYTEWEAWLESCCSHPKPPRTRELAEGGVGVR